MLLALEYVSWDTDVSTDDLVPIYHHVLYCISGISLKSYVIHDTFYGKIQAFLNPEYISSHNSVQFYLQFQLLPCSKMAFFSFDVSMKKLYKIKEIVSESYVVILPYNL